MSKRPVIGVSGSIIIDDGGRFPGYRRSYVNEDYIQAVKMAGGMPFIIPMTDDEELIRMQIESIDGLILSGGHDLDPLLYGEEPLQKLGGILPERDDFDCRLVKIAMELKKPILGICRGHHILNAANGGSNYQDLSYIEGCNIKHDQFKTSYLPTHTVDVESGTKLCDILGEKVMTNSFHHQAIKDVAHGFKVSARAKDGVIEAIEIDSDEFIVGVQWHPEMMAAKNNKGMLNLFKKLIEAAKK
ncbi:gamma-glutamyl-gamma-aminobutyrate hydrolase family protein [Anaeromicrobium sediminis]|uniref:Gamma-glutamyl-gamma-aminobutyrate hydrolase n=1 Tax=Anaeromicrobium sediminis TaxID=1478221 RepID=A0A267MHY8_9FIRM|nr:gamma-glutamyl-gamma-aminobutyrate hydrolase family protein [Anaeromicrobium sediminis]PAB59022.1 gamma-glutamyl-gamma-aminobutyrate hydrolase [Anaeromicrobium sediminis]